MKIRTTLIVEGMIAGRQRAASARHGLVVAVDGQVVVLRDLIEAIVRAELEACITHSAEARLVRVLTEAVSEDSDEEAPRDRSGSDAALVDANVAVSAALAAHKKGQVQAIVDNVPITDPDALVDVIDGTRVRFLRDGGRSVRAPQVSAFASR